MAIHPIEESCRIVLLRKSMLRILGSCEVASMKKLLIILCSLAFLPSESSSAVGLRSVTIHAVAYSPDGKYLVTAGICRPVVLRDAATGKEVRRLAQCSSWEGNAVFTPDGKHVLATERSDQTSDDTVVLLPVSGTGEHIVVGKAANKAWIMQLALSGDGKTLAGVSGDAPVMLWDVATRSELRRLEGKGYRMGVALSPDGKTVASTEVDERAPQIWETGTGKALEAPSQHYRCVAFSPDGKRIALGRSDSILLWDLQTGKAGATLKTGGECLAFSADGKNLAAGHGKSIAIWDLTQSKKTSALEAMGLVTTLAFNPDGRSIAAGLYEPGGLQIWSLEDGKELVKLHLPHNDTK
jgi:WD40 repeat protein